MLLLQAATKEYTERSFAEYVKFLFLPEMVLLGSQAITKKELQFSLISEKNINFDFKVYFFGSLGIIFGLFGFQSKGWLSGAPV